MGGLHLRQRWSEASSKPYLSLISAVLIAATSVWMLHRTWRVMIGHDGHAHVHAHAHDPDHDNHGRAVPAMDSHAQAHAPAIARRSKGREVTTGQIVVFGLTIPCPASITVLLLCPQPTEIALGAALVLGFSVGLALTMVASGALAALSVCHAARRWGGLGAWADKAPYL